MKNKPDPTLLETSSLKWHKQKTTKSVETIPLINKP
jgi:hypothetical protein